MENDPDQVEMLRQLGHKVFYGDMTRKELLHGAGGRYRQVAGDRHRRP